MKIIFAFVLVCAAISFVKADDAEIEAAKKIAAECKEKTGASDEEAAIVFKTQLHSTQEGKCLRACVMKKLGMMDENNHLNVAKTVDIAVKVKQHHHEEIDRENYEKVVIACSQIDVPADSCEAAQAYIACAIEKAKENKH